MAQCPARRRAGVASARAVHRGRAWLSLCRPRRAGAGDVAKLHREAAMAKSEGTARLRTDILGTQLTPDTARGVGGQLPKCSDLALADDLDLDHLGLAADSHADVPVALVDHRTLERHAEGPPVGAGLDELVVQAARRLGVRHRVD